MNDFSKCNIELSDIVSVEIPTDFTNSDSMKDAVMRGGKLEITIDAAHSGIINGNMRLYRPDMMAQGAATMIGTPFVPHHEDNADPIGRTVDAVYEDIASDEFRSEFPEYQFSNFWKGGDETPFDAVFELNPRGLGRLMIKNSVGDQDAIEKILDQRYLGVSVKFRTDAMDCSCGKQKAPMGIFGPVLPDDDDEADKLCCHRPGSYTDEQHHFNIPGMLKYLHSSVVNEPADPHARIVGTEFVDMIVTAEDGKQVSRAQKEYSYYNPFSVRSAQYTRRDQTEKDSWLGSKLDADQESYFADLMANDPKLGETLAKVAKDLTEDELKQKIIDKTLLSTYNIKIDRPERFMNELQRLFAIDNLEDTKVPELTKEELLELDEVKSLLDEAKTEGASSRDDEVTALTDEAAELKDSTATLTEERDDARAQSEQFKDGLDMVAEKFKNFLIDEIVYNRGVMGIENYTDGVDAAKEKLGARNVDSLLDAINDDREKLDASRQSLEPGSVNDPGTGLTDDDSDDDPTPDSKPNEILDSYLEGLGISFQSKTDE
jgi:hypothetical protein